MMQHFFLSMYVLGALLYVFPVRPVFADTQETHVIQAPTQEVNQIPTFVESPANTPPMLDTFSTPSSYQKTFIISAYYSPLQGQNKYVTGSYTGDIRLNGGGVHGADGTDVYPGMIAAPKSYAFGTKMEIPGIGIVAVHDRGGAIVQAGQRNQAYDRLDVWMGFGDEGLSKALQWGRRTVDVTVYGLESQLQEQVHFENSPSMDGNISKPNAGDPALFQQDVPLGTAAFQRDLKFGDRGKDVEKLQIELQNMNLLAVNASGYYGPITQHAVFKLQQNFKLIGDRTSPGAGRLGSKTREHLNALIVQREQSEKLVADRKRADEELN